MIGNRRLLAVLLSFALIAPVAAASGTHSDSLETGESDVYHVDDEKPTLGPCTQDIFWVRLVLTLEQPAPDTAVSLTLGEELPQSEPVDVATTENPTADVYAQLGGCDREATAVVTGLQAPSGVSYTLETEYAEPGPHLDSRLGDAIDSIEVGDNVLI